MTGYDPQKGDLLATADSIYQVGVTDGKAAQQATIDGLNAAIATLQAGEVVDEQQIATLTAKVAELQAYKDSHPDTPPPPPPPPAQVLYGANFGTGPDTSRYPKIVPVARIFPGSGYASDLSSMAAVKAAIAAKATSVILDFPGGTSDAAVTATVKQARGLFAEVWAAGVHEPEHNNKMSAKDWVAQQVHLAPIIRAAGGKVAPILQSATLASLQGRNPADYALPQGTVDAWGTDIYPLTKAIPQAQLLTAILAGAKIAFPGATNWIVGEYGVPAGNAQLVKDFKAFGAKNGLLRAAFWSQADTVLAADTAAAWF